MSLHGAWNMLAAQQTPDAIPAFVAFVVWIVLIVMFHQVRPAGLKPVLLAARLGRSVEFLASVAAACRQLRGDFTGLAGLADCRFCSDRVRDHPAHLRSPQQHGCGHNALVGLEIPCGTARGPCRADWCGADGTGRWCVKRKRMKNARSRYWLMLPAR